jgi:hypothetical protein
VASNKGKNPDKTILIKGHRFDLYKYYDNSLGEELINYPNFKENPEYTNDDRPFVMAIQECCPLGEPIDLNNSDLYDCSGCKWFFLESPTDAIGVCMCDVLRRQRNDSK